MERKKSCFSIKQGCSNSKTLGKKKRSKINVDDIPYCFMT